MRSGLPQDALLDYAIFFFLHFCCKINHWLCIVYMLYIDYLFSNLLPYLLLSEASAVALWQGQGVAHFPIRKFFVVGKLSANLFLV